ncbi:hypothetical protein BGX33_011933 [Mortierella sp. NVP41]|nr:hypothetical protein BGX33_011933 [Mortierella sp. NVP41]
MDSIVDCTCFIGSSATHHVFCTSRHLESACYWRTWTSTIEFRMEPAYRTCMTLSSARGNPLIDPFGPDGEHEPYGSMFMCMLKTMLALIKEWSRVPSRIIFGYIASIFLHLEKLDI